MWECFQGEVLLLFLPTHSSHITQPLDLTVFRPIKAYYRRELARLVSAVDSSPIGKTNFLYCYQKARRDGLTRQNIISGWRTAGLWPVNRAKVLMSSQLLPQTSQEARVTPARRAKRASTTLDTPQKSGDLYAYRDAFINTPPSIRGDRS